RYSGMRPGEVRRLRLAEVDRSGDVWVYRPADHKTRHKGKSRAVYFGPRAKAVLAAFVERRGNVDPDEPLFSPRAEREERYRAMRAARKTPVQPSQVCRRKATPKRAPAAMYTRTSYATAI